VQAAWTGAHGGEWGVPADRVEVTLVYERNRYDLYP